MSTILVVDDDAPLREFLNISLSAHGYEVLEAGSGAAALSCVQTHAPDALLLDCGLPDLSGVEVTRLLRKWSWTPVLFVSVRDDEETIVSALDAGADDYLTKPFRLPELLARLRAALRRKPGMVSEGVLRCGKLKLDQDARSVTVAGQRANLTPNEFGILQQLMLNQGRVVSHHKLLYSVWGEAQALDNHLLRVHMSNLRKKLEAFETLSEYIINEPGIGYRLSCPEE